MKCNTSQLRSQLSKNLPVCALVSGDDTFLVHESVAALTEKAKQAGYSEHMHKVILSNEELTEVLAETTTGSLFASKRVCELHCHKLPQNVKSAELLKKLVASADENTLVIVVTGKLNKSAQNKAWVKHIDQTGIWVTVWPLSEQEHIRWLQNNLNSKSLNIESDALHTLFELTFGNLVIADQEIRKLELLYPKHHLLSRDDILQAIADNARFQVFELIDNALMGKVERVEHAWRQMYQSGVDPLQITGILTSNLYQLLQLTLTMEMHRDRRQEARNMGIIAIKLKVFEAAMQRLRKQQITALLRYAARLDSLIKGMHKGNPYIATQALLLAIAGKQTPALHLLGRATHGWNS